MGVRLYVENNHGQLASVETETEDDFMFFREIRWIWPLKRASSPAAFPRL